MKTTHQLNVLLVAEEAAGVHVLRLISNSGHTLAGVLTTGDSPVDAAARSLGVPVLEAEAVQDPGFAEWMDSHHVDVLLNVHSLYRICPEVIQAARTGAFNLHPGPLPRYSGLNAPSWAVYNEEPEHAVTLHRITGRIDAGHIVYETPFPLTSKDTGLTVSLTCVRKGLELIERLLNELSRDPISIPSRPQDLDQRTFYKRDQVPGNGFIQWSAPAHKIDAFVRACNYAPFPSPWGEPKTKWKDTEISILKTEPGSTGCDEAPGTVGPMIDGKASVATGKNWLLVDKCKVEEEIVAGASFLNPGDLLTPAF